MLVIEYSKGAAYVKDQSTKDILRRGFFGTGTKKRLELSPEEALYLVDVRNAECVDGKKQRSFNYIASRFSKSDKFMARYLTYKDWRDRGLVAADPRSRFMRSNRTPVKSYPKASFRKPGYRVDGLFFDEDLMTIVDDKARGEKLYSRYWFGQFGSYKAAERGRLNKLDIFETLFLLEKGVLRISNATKNGVRSAAASRRKDFTRLYEVYKDWREKGYVIKTGFKFGTHFRVYFPGAKPKGSADGEWAHSKHVIQVFPKESRLLISEWARAIRVAHSVRKTFILAVPGTRSGASVSIDYILFHRRGGEAENPKDNAPRFAMLSLSEDEYIGGREFASAIDEAKKRNLELILAIADRETAVTYYRVRQIKLPGSTNEYYEIDWMQP